MKTIKRRLLVLLIITALLLTGLPNLSVHGATASGEFMVAPPNTGANVSSRFVSVGSSYIDSSLPQVVVITDNVSDANGGLWTTGRLDLRFTFSVRFFLYWGRSQSREMASSGGQIGGDGMAISLQNDPRGTSSLGGRGGAVGAYLRPGEPAVIPLRNAISFEVDPFINFTAGDFDAGMSVNTTTPNLARHMAFVVPSDPLGSAKHISLSSFQDMGFTDSVWIPVTVQWIPSGTSGTLMLVVNGNTRTYVISNYNTFFGGNLAYFGFTGATGGVTALQAVAMQTMPLFTYNLGFNLNGGTGTTPATQTVQEGSLASAPANPTRTGFNFSGWNTAANGSGTSWNFGSTVMPQNDVTLFAQWTRINYNLSFNVNNGDGTNPPTQSVPFGTLASNPGNPTRVGHNFTGWNTVANGSGSTWNFATTTMPANSVNLFAQWAVASFPLSFNLNGATGTAPVTQTIPFNTTATAPPNPSWVGHTFAGWNTAANGSGTAWNFATTTMPGNPVTLFAQWTTNNYDLSFNVNGGDSAKPDTQNVPFGTLATAPGAPTKLGHTFTGWNTAANGSGTTWNFATTTMPASHTTLYAQWAINSYDLSFNVNGGDSTAPDTQTLEFGSPAAEPTVPTKEGHTFLGWNTMPNGMGETWVFNSTTMPANPVTLFAQWEINSYDLSFNVNGGNSAPPTTQTVIFNDLGILPPTPTRVGHTFASWNTAADGSGTTWNFATSRMPANHVLLYAQWTINNYDVVFNLNDGDGVAPPDQSVTYQDFISPVTDPTRLGYVFVGWNTAQDGSGTTWNFASNRMPANNITLFAQWVPDTFNLHFNINGGAGLAPASQEVLFGDLVTPVTPPEREGFTFSSWNTAQDGNGVTWDFANTTMPAVDTTLFAQWQVNTYTLSFDLQGGEGTAPSSQDVEFEDFATPVGDPTKVGYSFLGWNTAANGSGTTWNFATSRMPASHTTLYALWSVESYELSFDVNEGTSLPPDTQTVIFNTLATEPLPPTRIGHTFAGWNTMPNGLGVTWDFASTLMPGNPVVLFAQWTPNSYELSFHVNGGDSVAPNSQTIVFNTLATEPAPPTRVGYTFTSWNTDPDGNGVVWDFGTTTMPATATTLYAQWSVNSYDLSFNVNGGDTPAPDTQTVTFNTLAATPAPPSRVGHTFAGWNTLPNGLGVTWNFASTLMPGNPVVLYAQWSVNSYDLSFNVNEGNSAPPATQTVTYNTLAIAPAPPTRMGHTFTGWNTAADGMGTVWNFGTTTMPATDTELFAQWSINSYPLNFHVNGGESADPATQMIVFHELATLPPPPTRLGYTFVGWNTVANGSGITWDFATNRMPANPVNLYAQWSVDSFEVTFDVNEGDSVAPDSQTIDFEQPITRPADPTRLGHTFVGWNTTADGSGQNWNFTLDTMPAHPVTLYAQWSINSYMLHFNLHGGSGTTPSSQSVVFGSTATAVTDPVRSGFTFAGWNTVADGTGATWDFATSRMPASEVTLFAQWSRNSYSVTFDLNSGDGTAPGDQNIAYQDLVSPVADPTRLGHVFVGWNTALDGSGTTWDFESNKMPAAPVTLFAQWTLDTFNLHFNINGGAGLAPVSQEVFFGTLATPVADPGREGHTFSTWNTAKDGSGLTWDFASTTMPAGNTILYAQWQINTYTLSFDLQGGDGTTPASQQVDFESLAMPVPDPTKVGHTFVGWNTAPDGSGTTWDFATSLMPASHVTLYANWSVNSYNLHFNTNGGQSTPPASQMVPFNTLATAVDNPDRIGFTFIGWNTAPDGSGSTWDLGATTMPANNLTLYAQWSVNNYQLSFNVNGGDSVAPVPQTLDFDELAVEPMAPTRLGHTFIGWNSESDGSGSMWDFASSRMPAVNTMLYAQWSTNDYQLSFDLNQGDSEAVPTQVVLFDALATAPDTPLRTGHTFTSWNTKADGTGDTWDFAITQMPAKDVTLYAQWTRNQYEVTFESNGGSAVVSQKVLFEDLVKQPLDPARPGYVFKGWYRDEALKGLWNFATDPVESDMMLYARWHKNEHPPVLTAPIFTEIKINSTFDPKAGVEAFDWFDKDITDRIEVTGTVDITKVGVYQLDYVVTDVVGNQALATQIVLVNDGSFTQENGYIIHGNDFKLKISEFSLSDKELIARAGVTLYSIEQRKFLDNAEIRVDRSQIKKAAGVYPVTFTFNPAITVKATVVNDIPVAKTGEIPGDTWTKAMALLLLAGVVILTRKEKFRRIS